VKNIGFLEEKHFAIKFWAKLSIFHFMEQWFYFREWKTNYNYKDLYITQIVSSKMKSQLVTLSTMTDSICCQRQNLNFRKNYKYRKLTFSFFKGTALIRLVMISINVIFWYCLIKNGKIWKIYINQWTNIFQMLQNCTFISQIHSKY
jgi:hypothetical protein